MQGIAAGAASVRRAAGIMAEGPERFMCGIGLILRLGAGDIPEAWLDELDAAIRDRGPDGAGRHRDRSQLPDGTPVHLAMVHRRLAVIDPVGGHQPMVHAPDGPTDPQRAAIVFNGCLADHGAVRRELEAAGVRFRSDHSDTEVLLQAVRHWGATADAHLEGMRAAAIWRADPPGLQFTRDAFGEKPLWVAVRRQRNGERLLVAGSNPGAVGSIAERFGGRAARDPATARKMMRPLEIRGSGHGPEAGSNSGEAGFLGDDRWLDRYLAVGYTGSQAAGAVFAWPPARLDGAAAGAASDVDPSGVRDEDEDAILASIDEALAAAVERRLESDVPLGCFLSGGVDSSLVAHHARRALGSLRTFAVRMPDPRHDESAHAADAAAAIGSDHTTLDADPGGRAAEDFVALIAAAGAPFADSSILPAAWVSRAAREHVTVCLGGDGGDELFMGYDRYRAAPLVAAGVGEDDPRPARLLRFIPRGLGRGPRRHPRGRLRRVGRLGTMIRDAHHDGLMAMERVIDRSLHQRLRPGIDLDAEFVVTALLSGQLWAPHAPDGAADDLRMLDLCNYLPGDLLVKMDVASMHHALEVRSPMLDRELARRALAIPTRQHLGPPRFGVHPHTKAVLRALAARVIGPAAHRPKQGFAIPVAEWLREDVGGLGTLLGDALGRTDPFGRLPVDATAARTMHREHREGRRDHGAALFALLGLAVWADRYPALTGEA